MAKCEHLLLFGIILPVMTNQLGTTLEAIGVRCDEITAAMTGDCPSTIFALHEREKTWQINAALLKALSGMSSVEELTALQEKISRVEEQVYVADEAVAARIGGDPRVIAGFMNAQRTFFRLLTDADPTVRVLAGAAVDHLATVRSIVMGMYAEIHQQLQIAEGIVTHPLLRGVEKMVSGLGGLLGRQIAETFSRYAEVSTKEMRTTRQALVRAYHSESASLANFKGPRTKEKHEQVADVMRYLARTSGPMDIAAACRTVFKPIKGGYASAHDLYLWCHRNEPTLRAVVDDLRLS